MKTMNRKTVVLGSPVKSPFLIPVRHSSSPACINSAFTVNGEIYKLTCVSFGNPNGALFVDDIASVDVEFLGMELGYHKLFPVGANIVFIEIVDKNEVKARVWQRGIGEVAFSREGAAAALFALIANQKILTDSAVISMAGGSVEARLDRFENIVYLSGDEELLGA